MSTIFGSGSGYGSGFGSGSGSGGGGFLPFPPAEPINIIDYKNYMLQELHDFIDSLQERYLDPYTIRLTTDTNNYFFIERDINGITTSIYDDNRVIKGLNIKQVNVNIEEEFVDVIISKGVLIIDNTIIKFNEDFTIRVPYSWVDMNNNEFNIVGFDYVHSQVYPPRIVYPFVTKQSNTRDFEPKVISSAFKLDDYTITKIFPDHDNDSLYVVVNYNKIFKIIDLDYNVTFIKQPIIFHPQNDGILSSDESIAATPFSCSSSVYEYFNDARWQIATDISFTNIVESGFGEGMGEGMVTYTPENLTDQQVYYVRVRYSGDYFKSKWSEPVRFTYIES